MVVFQRVSPLASVSKLRRLFFERVEHGGTDDTFPYSKKAMGIGAEAMKTAVSGPGPGKKATRTSEMSQMFLG